jgi:hypothetical protein
MGGMPLGPVSAAAVVVTTTIGFGWALASSPGSLETVAVAACTTSLTVLSLSSAAGMLLSRGRWARWVAVVVPTSWTLVAGAAGHRGGWIFAGLGAAAIVSLAAGPGSRGWIRSRPAAHGPPPSSVVLLLSLVGYPIVVALSDPGSPWSTVATAAVLVAAAIYSRGGVLGTYTMRAFVIAAVVAAVAGSPRSLGPAVAGIAIVVLSWRPTIAQAAAPLLPVPGSGYRIPAELTPPEILDAAGLDERGRKR